MENRTPESIDQVLAVLLDQNDHFTGFDSFAGICQCKTIRAVDQVVVGERLVRLTGVLQDDAGLVGDFLIGALEEVGESGHLNYCRGEALLRPYVN